ncbi:hypothetical protein PISMIDRAFT_112668 [Pisolithus microcarpus 441]|uniref:Reverse transcriptase zinc-binding domain-containing protein n=1 Tax=Pisolithus microcarpus 441 TaxID=765257 RepID=A0A0C9YJD1_9AGAM|nr:hypothetical protein BKA83DRAFT_112668 [Pisolithus microcarpus]KIK16811.1 hypothetical protein PISMIDRAFT_112668 [Pisolithus microcarpus 441]
MAYIRLHTSHIGLNKHLFCIKKVNSPGCHCGALEESVEHFLVVCPLYNRACHCLLTHLGHKALQISYLLTSQEALPHLMEYIAATKHFAKPIAHE